MADTSTPVFPSCRVGISAAVVAAGGSGMSPSRGALGDTGGGSLLPLPLLHAASARVPPRNNRLFSSEIMAARHAFCIPESSQREYGRERKNGAPGERGDPPQDRGCWGDRAEASTLSRLRTIYTPRIRPGCARACYASLMVRAVQGELLLPGFLPDLSGIPSTRGKAEPVAGNVYVGVAGWSLPSPTYEPKPGFAPRLPLE